ncbi:hypothetical protein [Saccharibacillus endophyticus]|uniref:DUF4025 domain-containing protein n=1 Tax=Saccharibacillus endophyticus TaxID=2060666 RepID=A0ABQ1ZV70_9BACL|nr:hypothetical protein [Saccharibacillus endophyticus]GGH80178.1 hypothetical protein GCM10007362_28090 [Saccharibacillus endophyticus]
MAQKPIDYYLRNIGKGTQAKDEKTPVIKTKSVLEGADSMITTRTEHFTQSSEIREEKKLKPEED